MTKALKAAVLEFRSEVGRHEQQDAQESLTPVERRERDIVSTERIINAYFQAAIDELRRPVAQR